MNIYVKKCGARNNFRYFLFNNNVLQGIFKDGTEMLISPTSNIYINKYGEQKVFISCDELKEEALKKFEFLSGLLKNYKQNSRSSRPVYEGK